MLEPVNAIHPLPIPTGQGDVAAPADDFGRFLIELLGGATEEDPAQDTPAVSEVATLPAHVDPSLPAPVDEAQASTFRHATLERSVAIFASILSRGPDGVTPQEAGLQGILPENQMNPTKAASSRLSDGGVAPAPALLPELPATVADRDAQAVLPDDGSPGAEQPMGANRLAFIRHQPDAPVPPVQQTAAPALRPAPPSDQSAAEPPAGADWPEGGTESLSMPAAARDPLPVAAKETVLPFVRPDPAQNAIRATAMAVGMPRPSYPDAPPEGEGGHSPQVAVLDRERPSDPPIPVQASLYVAPEAPGSSAQTLAQDARFVDPATAHASDQAGLPPVQNAISGSQMPQAATATLPSLPPHLVPDLVRLLSSPPDGTVTLTLRPEELGTLHFHLSQAGEDMRIHLTVDQPATLDLLRRHADQLVAELRQTGFGNATLSFSGGDTRDGAPRDQAPSHGYAESDLPANPAHPASRVVQGALDLRL